MVVSWCRGPRLSWPSPGERSRSELVDMESLIALQGRRVLRIGCARVSSDAPDLAARRAPAPATSGTSGPTRPPEPRTSVLLPHGDRSPTFGVLDVGGSRVDPFGE